MTGAAGSFDLPLLTLAEMQALLRAGRALVPSLLTRRTPQSGRPGELSATAVGSGMEFAETRPYAVGDELRKINWRASARSGRLQVQRHTQDIMPAHACVIDLRARMRFGTRRRLKAAQAMRLAILLASAHAAAGSALAGLLLDPYPRWLTPSGGGAGALRFAHAVNRACPPLLGGGSEPHLLPALAVLNDRLAAGGHLHIISDLADLATTDRSALQRLGRRYQLTLWRVSDRVEREPPTRGDLRFAWPNGVSTGVMPASVPGVRFAEIGAIIAAAGLVSHQIPAELDELAELLAGIA